MKIIPASSSYFPPYLFCSLFAPSSSTFLKKNLPAHSTVSLYPLVHSTPTCSLPPFLHQHVDEAQGGPTGGGRKGGANWRRAGPTGGWAGGSPSCEVCGAGMRPGGTYSRAQTQTAGAAAAAMLAVPLVHLRPP